MDVVNQTTTVTLLLYTHNARLGEFGENSNKAGTGMTRRVAGLTSGSGEPLSLAFILNYHNES